jgi:cytochrome c oxidase subunit 1/cytochrome c oxidase subunit I+III
MVISIPSGVQIFSALATLWYGKLNIKTPLLYVLGFIITFVIGGISGVMIASVPFDLQAQDSYFVVAHLHYVLIGGAVFPLLGAMYYWFPKMTGRCLNERMGQLNFWLTFIGFNVAFFPMHLSGLYGMPRRIYTYLPGMGWDLYNFISTVGALILGVGVLLFVINVVNSLLNGELAPDNPWGGGTLEWATTSPPQPNNFSSLPIVQSRYPVWDTPNTLASYKFEENPDRRETLGTSALDAIPEMRVILAEDSIIPFLLALAITGFLVSTMIDMAPLEFFTAVCLVLLAIWFWPMGKELSLDWVKSGPPNALPVSTVVQGKGKHPPFYYGMWMFITIETVEFLCLIASYFYLRTTQHDWPPGDLPYPDLIVGAVATVLMLASIIPTYLGDEAIKHDNQRGLLIHLALTMLIETAFVALLTGYLFSLNYRWQDNAYTSLFWTLLVTHILFAATMVLENLYVFVQTLRGFYNSERHWGVEVDGLSSYFVVASWLAIYLTVFLSPYVIK